MGNTGNKTFFVLLYYTAEETAEYEFAQEEVSTYSDSVL